MDAFSSVNIGILLSYLANIGCSGSVVELFKHKTYDRVIRADCLEGEVRYADRGVSQVSVFSSLLYLIYVVNDLPKRLCVSQFTNDMAVYIKFNFVKHATKTIENLIAKIRSALMELDLTLSPNKTELLHFNDSKKHIIPGSTSISISGTVIYSSVAI